MATPAQPNSTADSIPEKLEAMFAHFFRRRRARRYIWTPAVDFSERRIILAMMTFGH